HPVHVEPVTELVGRAEILAAIFLMLGLLALLPECGTPTAWRMVAAAVAFFGAVMSKETGVCYPLLALSALAQRYGEPDENAAGLMRRFGKWAGVLAAPLVIYLTLRYIALEFTFFSGPPIGLPLNSLAGEGPMGRVIGILCILGEYTRLVF